MGGADSKKGSCPNLLHEQQPQVTVHRAGESLEAKTLQIRQQSTEHKTKTLNVSTDSSELLVGSIHVHARARLPSLLVLPSLRLL